MKLLREARLRAPELLPLAWAAGEGHLLGALHGRVVLLDFFSFADPEGVSGLPHLRMLSEHYRDAGLTVIGVHVPAYDFERPVEAARQEVWRLGIPYPVALDQSLDVLRAYEGRDLPARYVIDASGFVRGWHHGPGGLVVTERAVRALLREAHPGRELPHILEPSPGMMRPGGLHWATTPEVLFGTRGAGFGPPDEADAAPDDGDTRDFGDLPELRAQGRAYLVGRWSVHHDRVVSEDERGTVAIVFEGASVAAVISVTGTPDAEGDDAGRVELEVTLDGDPPGAAAGGTDLEYEEGRAVLAPERGRLYDLIASTDFGLHNLNVDVRGRGAAFHLLHFGSSDVPEEA